MDKDAKRILIELTKRDAVLGDELAFLIHKSTRSVRKIIRSINDEIAHFGSQIESGTNFGYRLVPKDSKLLKDEIGRWQERDSDFDENRIAKIISILSHQNGYMTIDDLCDRLYLSRTQLKQSLNDLRSHLKSHDLELDVKPHHGIRIFGDEINIRKAVFELVIELDKTQRPSDEFQSIKNIVTSCIVNTDYLISDDVLNDLVKQISIQCYRIKSGCMVNLDSERLTLIEHELEYPIAQQILILMNKINGLVLYPQEVAYLTMHLSGKNANLHASIYLDKEAFYFIEEILRVLDEQSIYHFSQDLNLRLALAQHMSPLRKRIQYSLYLKNPLLTEIKTKLLEAYDLAIKIAAVINEAYMCSLPEDEIAYMALHINLSMEQSKSIKRKSRILLICTGGTGTSRLIEHFFRSNFEVYIDDLDVCSLQELDLASLVTYDCVFSTVELPQETKSPVFIIDTFLNQNDAQNIKQNLTKLAKKNISEYFPESLFFTDIQYDSKSEIIHSMVEACRNVYDLPDDFENRIWEREEISSTEYNGLIAFPHATQSGASSTFVAVAILYQPIQWLNGKVRIILLSLVEEHPDKELNHFYGVISSLITDEQAQWKMINNPSYESFIQLIEKIEANL